MYIRFVVGNDDEDHRWLTGMITEARMLRDRGELESYETERHEGIFCWLNENFPCPPFEADPQLKKGACRFKPSARDAISKIWEVVNLLKEHDVPFACCVPGCLENVYKKTTFSL